MLAVEIRKGFRIDKEVLNANGNLLGRRNTSGRCKDHFSNKPIRKS